MLPLQKAQRPRPAYLTVARARIHLWKTERVLTDMHGRGLYLQMVLLSKNVTFDSGLLTRNINGLLP